MRSEAKVNYGVRGVRRRTDLSVPKKDEPGEVRAKNGMVILRCGPDFACVLSPDAAVITSDRLFRAGIRAKRQERRLDEAENR
jgi:hypothetical protein